MADPARVIPPAIDIEVEQALSLCGGDSIKALQVTLIANAFLEARLDQLTAEASAGFSRGRVRKPARKSAPKTEPKTEPQPELKLGEKSP